MSIFDQISKDIIAAMKAKDAVRRDALRNVKKVFLEAKTAPGAGDELSDVDAMKILQKLAKQGREAADIFIQQGRQDLADAELAQVAVYADYLPKQLSDAELEVEVKAVIEEIGATSIKEMGKVMGLATKKLSGRADGRAVSECVKRLLS
ncbi:MAG: GatB/YqeY domain-containing protein [Prevotellaceae bacterium]|nr:GatB/YqeY domain-containing protein [Prevotellaceae bacterium]MDO4931899.1 GatB/YqeY domain-containing protein [Prevotellaceae bacterium]